MNHNNNIGDNINVGAGNTNARLDVGVYEMLEQADDSDECDWRLKSFITMEDLWIDGQVTIPFEGRRGSGRNGAIRIYNEAGA